MLSNQSKLQMAIAKQLKACYQELNKFNLYIYLYLTWLVIIEIWFYLYVNKEKSYPSKMCFYYLLDHK